VGAARIARNVENTQRWLLRKVPEVMAIDAEADCEQSAVEDVNEKGEGAPRHNERSTTVIDELHKANPGAQP